MMEHEGAKRNLVNGRFGGTRDAVHGAWLERSWNLQRHVAAAASNALSGLDMPGIWQIIEVCKLICSVDLAAS